MPFMSAHTSAVKMNLIDFNICRRVFTIFFSLVACHLQERLIENQPNTIIITRNGHSKLIINNITSNQSGKYSVEIMNEHSQDLASVSVAVESVPDAPIALSISKGSDRIAVAWSGPPFDGGCMLSGFM